MASSPPSEPSDALCARVFPDGTTVVTLRAVTGVNGRTQFPRGAVGVVVKTPTTSDGLFRVRFPDGFEESMASADLTTLAKFNAAEINGTSVALAEQVLRDRVILQCVTGSQAYGLADAASDVDRRGIYLPPARLHWSLHGVPEQLECHETQESYWELQKFLVLALKANPGILECLYSPLVEQATPLAEELLEQRSIFLSRLAYQTYNGYVMSQFKKMQADLRNHGQVKWKHVMHLIRLLLSGIHLLREGFVQVQVPTEFREQLLAIKAGNMPWTETEKWRKSLQRDLDQALVHSSLPERPDYAAADRFLIRARHASVQDSLP